MSHTPNGVNHSIAAMVVCSHRLPLAKWRYGQIELVRRLKGNLNLPAALRHQLQEYWQRLDSQLLLGYRQNRQPIKQRSNQSLAIMVADGLLGHRAVPQTIKSLALQCLALIKNRGRQRLHKQASHVYRRHYRLQSKTVAQKQDSTQLQQQLNHLYRTSAD